MGRRIQKGINEVAMMDNAGKMNIIPVNLQVESIGGFSGHSDRRQLINYLTHLVPKPERIFICHGEKSKIRNLAGFLDRKADIHSIIPQNLETFRL
jgi:predicted metal-dependent RNase